MVTMCPASSLDLRVVSQSNSRYRGPPWIIQLDPPVVPAPQSPFSSSSTERPRKERSRATPAPVTPPPITHTSCALEALMAASPPNYQDPSPGKESSSACPAEGRVGFA